MLDIVYQTHLLIGRLAMLAEIGSSFAAQSFILYAFEGISRRMASLFVSIGGPTAGTLPIPSVKRGIPMSGTVHGSEILYLISMCVVGTPRAHPPLHAYNNICMLCHGTSLGPI